MKTKHKDYEGTVKTVIASNKGVTLYFEDGETAAIKLPMEGMVVSHIKPKTESAVPEGELAVPEPALAREEYEEFILSNGIIQVYRDPHGRE